MTKVIILAAGKGSRMKSDIPKTLFPINDRPMIEYLIDSIIESGVDTRPLIVVSPGNKKKIQEALGQHNVSFCVQEEPLGTGHAVLSTKNFIEEDIENIIVLYGDHPFITKKSIKKLLNEHKSEVSMMVVKVDDFDDWKKNFYYWGRIVREGNKIKKIVEFKDSDDKIKKIKEVNPALFCFNKKWLFDNIDKIKNNNNQQEYYLTDLIKKAFDQNINIGCSFIEAKEAIGVNSPEELSVAREIAGKESI
jgi:bifunctional UDP-N-acetylglucosamine pyrophosphorylase / glucosamine-1-phosphate N-acetyltransferase